MIIKEYRKKKGYSQEQLAELVEVTPRQIQRIENETSDTSLKTLRKFIKILEITDEDIIKIVKQ